MSLIVGEELRDLCCRVLKYGYTASNVGATSYDVTLGSKLLVERCPLRAGTYVVDPSAREALHTKEYDLTLPGVSGFELRPGEFILAHADEEFELPIDVSMQYSLTSTLARSGLNQSTALWCWPGWHGVPTLELSNVTRFHNIVLKPGMVIGQVSFFRHSATEGYHGAYAGDTTVVGAKPK